MKFTCEKSSLQNACSIASRAAAAKSPIPALEGLLLKAERNLTVTGYDLKKGIYTSIEADIAENGSIVVSSRFFNEMLRRLPDGTITVSTDEKDNVNVKCGKSEYNFIGIESKDYPEMPSVDGENNISLPQGILAEMINQTIFAVANNDSRPVYTGTLFEVSRDELTLVSVDGFRLARRSEKIEDGNMEECSFIVPGSTLSDVERICGEEDEKVEISVGKKHISFILGETVVVSRRLEGEFMNYKKSIPEEFKYQIKIDRNEMISTIDRVSLIVSEKNLSPVRMTFRDGSIDCLCMTPVGKAQDVCLCSGDGEDLLVGFNDRYMKDALKAADKDELLICLNTSSTPCIIKAADGEEKFTYMVLPVRLRAD